MRKKMVKNVSSIDEKKREIVSALCSMAEETPIVKRIVVFGSAANGMCTDSSDLDICYDIDCTVYDKRARELSVKTSKICDYNCDVVYYGIIGTNLRNEIDAKGVVVYES